MMLSKIWPQIDSHSASFQVVSDLHLEVNQQYSSFDIPVRAKHLILAGDIGRLVDYDSYRIFLERQISQFERVFLVLGNHEFYNDTFSAGLKKAQQLESDPAMNGRLVLLHRARYDIPGTRVTILGCTLWSKIPDEAKDTVRLMIQDFRNIQDWTVDDHNATHDSDLAWLLGEINSSQTKHKAQSKKQILLVVTHHAPSTKGTSSPQYAKSPWSSAFGTDVLPRISKSVGIKAWVFGHTHYTTEFKHGQVRVVSNQRGYVLSRSDTAGAKDGFDVEKVIHV
ncbi:Metallo-dependent phosphatase-like protein [Aspergillus falconensis]